MLNFGIIENSFRIFVCWQGFWFLLTEIEKKEII